MTPKVGVFDSSSDGCSSCSGIYRWSGNKFVFLICGARSLILTEFMWEDEAMRVSAGLFPSDFDLSTLRPSHLSGLASLCIESVGVLDIMPNILEWSSVRGDLSKIIPPENKESELKTWMSSCLVLSCLALFLGFWFQPLWHGILLRNLLCRLDFYGLCLVLLFC